MKGRNCFTQNEAEQIKQLLQQKIASGNQKLFRDQLRSMGFYISDYVRFVDGFSPEDFDSFVVGGNIVIINEATNSNSQQLYINKAQASSNHRIIGFPPIVSDNARVLIFGTMPGVDSLARNEYYAKVNNQFWHIMESICGISKNENYAERIARLKDKGIAIWDVLQTCERQGSLDENITDVKPNDFNMFFSIYLTIKAVFFNGEKARTYYEVYVQPRLIGKPSTLSLITLPSTSPANTKQTLIQKITIWQEKLLVFL